MLTLTLYSRADCCLCEDMKTVLAQVRQDVPFALEEIDVDTEPELQTLYGQEVPVLFVNGRKAFKYKLTVGELQRRLARENL